MLNSFFPAHGLCHYATDDNIVIIDSNGPFNLEFFKEMHADLIQYVTGNVDYRNFAILLIMRGNTLALPDGLAYHEVHVAKGTAKAIAVNLTHSDYASTTAKQMKRVYDKAGLKNATFEDIKEAKNWLNSHLE